MRAPVCILIGAAYSVAEFPISFVRPMYVLRNPSVDCRIQFFTNQR